MRKLILLLILAGFLISCGGSKDNPQPNPSAAKWNSAKWNEAKWE